MNFFFRKNNWVLPFWPQREWRNFGTFEIRTSWRETKNMQI